MDDHTAISTSRPRRKRALLWGLFGLTGILMSTAWATGFASSDTQIDGTNAADDVFGESAAQPHSPSPYQGLVTNPGNLAITFDGLWGVIEDPAAVFAVDLSGRDASEEFFVDIYLRNQPTGWSSAQLKWVMDTGCDVADPDTAGITAADAAAATDQRGDGAPKVMNITSTDAHVAFADLAGGETYCFGVAAAVPASQDATTTGTTFGGNFLTRPDVGATPTEPEFTAIVNRSA